MITQARNVGNRLRVNDEISIGISDLVYWRVKAPRMCKRTELRNFSKKSLHTDLVAESEKITGALNFACTRGVQLNDNRLYRRVAVCNLIMRAGRLNGKCQNYLYSMPGVRMCVWLHNSSAMRTRRLHE